MRREREREKDRLIDRKIGGGKKMKPKEQKKGKEYQSNQKRVS